MKAKGGVKKGGQGHERNRKAGPQALGLKRKQKSRDEDAESQSVEKKDRGHKKRQRAEDVGDDAAVLSMDLGGGGGDDLGFDDHLVGPLGDGGDSEGWVASGEGGGDGEGEEGGVEQRSGAEAGRGPGSEAVGQEDAAKARKKQKMKNRLREKKARLGGKEFAQEKERAATIVKSGASEQSDWLWACYGRYKPGSPLEREAFDAKYLVRLDQSKGLAEAVCIAFADRGGKEFVTKAGKATRKGAPVVLVITPNAAWASHACTQLRSLNGETARVAKLFARHFKVEEQQEWLRGHCVSAAVGTPNRLLKLADSDVLQLTRLQLVVLHVALDAKQRHLLELPETRGDTWDLFFRHLLPRLREGAPDCRVALCDLPMEPQGT